MCCAVVGLASALASGCLARGSPTESTFPPEDFYVEVWHRAEGEAQRRVRIWADGLVWLGEEVDAEGPVAAAGLPVFGSVCMYRLRPLSIRQLSRMLQSSGVYAMGETAPDTAAAARELTTLWWQAFHREGVVWAAPGASGAVARALRIIDSFLPPGHGVLVADATGEAEPPHVLETPAPKRSLADALAIVSHLVDERANRGLAIDALALALASGDHERARGFLDRVRRDDPALADRLQPLLADPTG